MPGFILSQAFLLLFLAFRSDDVDIKDNNNIGGDDLCSIVSHSRLNQSSDLQFFFPFLITRGFSNCQDLGSRLVRTEDCSLLKFRGDAL